MNRPNTFLFFTFFCTFLISQVCGVQAHVDSDVGVEGTVASTVTEGVLREENLTVLRKRIKSLCADSHPDYLDLVSVLTDDATIVRMLELSARMQKIREEQEDARTGTHGPDDTRTSLDVEFAYLQKHLGDILNKATVENKFWKKAAKKLPFSPKLLIPLALSAAVCWDLSKDKNVDTSVDTSADEPTYESHIRKGMQKATDNDVMSVGYMFLCFGHGNLNEFVQRQIAKPRFVMSALVSVFFAVDFLVRGKKSFVGMLKRHLDRGCAFVGQRADSWFQKHPYVIFPLLVGLGLGIYKGVSWAKQRYDWDKYELEENPLFFEVMPVVCILLVDRIIRGDSSLIGFGIKTVKAGGMKSWEYIRKSYDLVAAKAA